MFENSAQVTVLVQLRMTLFVATGVEDPLSKPGQYKTLLTPLR